MDVAGGHRSRVPRERLGATARRCCSCTGCRGARRPTTRCAPRSTPRIACSRSTSAGMADPIAHRARTSCRTTPLMSSAFIEWIGSPVALAGHSLGGAVATSLAGSRPDLIAGALLEDPPLYHGDREFFATTIFPGVFEKMRDTMRQMQDDGAGRDEVRAALLDMPTPTGGDLVDEATPATIESRVDAFLACDPSVFDPAITGDAIGGWDPDTPIPESVPLTLLRADATLEPAFLPTDEARFLARRAAHAHRRDRRGAARHPRFQGRDRPVSERAPLAARARHRTMSPSLSGERPVMSTVRNMIVAVVRFPLDPPLSSADAAAVRGQRPEVPERAWPAAQALPARRRGRRRRGRVPLGEPGRGRSAVRRRLAGRARAAVRPAADDRVLREPGDVDPDRIEVR